MLQNPISLINEPTTKNEIPVPDVVKMLEESGIDTGDIKMMGYVADDLADRISEFQLEQPHLPMTRFTDLLDSQMTPLAVELEIEIDRNPPYLIGLYDTGIWNIVTGLRNSGNICIPPESTVILMAKCRLPRSEEALRVLTDPVSKLALADLKKAKALSDLFRTYYPNLTRPHKGIVRANWGILESE